MTRLPAEPYKEVGTTYKSKTARKKNDPKSQREVTTNRRLAS